MSIGISVSRLQRQRVIRVFVSSTFQDMKEEREELVKRVFPKLRKICEQRGVTWGAVDLRWGITDEQQAEGKALPICLREIEDCRPYFIGILGDRYGYIPDEIPSELLEREAWLNENLNKSITELEMLHGALNDPATADHAYFYLRDPSYISPRFKSIEDDNPEKLESLKNRIRESGLPVRENYRNPKELGNLVFKDFTGIIDELYPEGSELNPLDRDALDHEAYAYSRFKIYIGREEYFTRLNQHVESGDKPLVVLGESGSGKSALLANWSEKYRENHPSDLVITHFIGATPYSSDWAMMIRRIMGELKRRYDIHEEVPDAPDKLQSTFANWLHVAASASEKAGHKIVLILDALNQLEDRDSAPDLIWLPPSIPGGIRMILSTLPGRSLDELEKREWQTIDIKLLENNEQTKLIRQYLGLYRKTLSDDRIERIAASEQTHNPLFLRALLDELSVFGVHLNLDRAVEFYLSSKSIPDLYQKILGRLEGDYNREWPGLVEDIMTGIWASGHGLTENEILDLCGAAGNPLPQAQWAEFQAAIERLMVSRSGLMGFAHDYVRDAIRERFLARREDRKRSHERLVEYFQGNELSPRKVKELPWQLLEVEDWQGLYDLLLDLDFFKMAMLENEFELKSWRVKIQENSDLDIVDAYRSVLDEPASLGDNETTRFLARFLNDTGHMAESISLMEYLIGVYRDSGDKLKLAATLRDLGAYQVNFGKLEIGKEHYRESEQISRELGDLQGLNESLYRQGDAIYKQGQFESALKLFRDYEKFCRDRGDMHGLATCLTSQGYVYSERGDHKKALELYRESERINRMRGDRSRIASSLSEQGSSLLRLGEMDKALRLFEESEAISRELGYKSGICQSLNSQGEIHFCRGDLDRTLEMFRQSEQICRETGAKRMLSNMVGNIGLALRYKGDPEGAMVKLLEQEEICREIGYIRGLSNCLGNQGIVHKDLGDLESAMECYKKDEHICRELDRKESIAISLINQGGIHMDLDRLDEAGRAFDESEQISREINAPRPLINVFINKANLFIKRNDLDSALTLAKEALDTAERLGFATEIEESKGVLDEIKAKLKPV